MSDEREIGKYKLGIYKHAGDIKENKRYLETFNLDDNTRKMIESNHQYREIPIGGMIDTIFQEYKEEAEEDGYVQMAISVLYESLDDLTDRQKEIVGLYLAGNTQQKIGDEIGITQGSVSLAWHGVLDAKRGKYYGGILKKLRRVILERAEAHPGLKDFLLNALK